MWLSSQDDMFREKRDDVLHVYYDTPDNEWIICVDEKSQMQALEREHPDIAMELGMPVRRDSGYIRHGTQVLMGGYDVRTGKLFGFMADHHGTEMFLCLLDQIDQCYPTGKGHIICDNLSTHLHEDVEAWFEAHPRWTLHFTPTHASWLNQIECAFSLLQRQVIARGSFQSTEELRERVYAWILWYNERARPFSWTYKPNSWTNKSALTCELRN